MYINIPFQYDIVSILGSMRNVKKVMKYICAAYLDSRWKHFEPPHDKTNKMTFMPSKDSYQPGHPPRLIRVFAVRSVGSLGPNFASGGQHRLWADAQADLSPRWAHRSFCWFVMPWLNFHIETTSETIAYGIVTNLNMRN